MGTNGGFAFLDLETTGFGHKSGDRIVEVGVVVTDENLDVQTEWTTLINPLRDPGVSGVHGIRKEWLQGAPQFSEIADELSILLKNRRVVIHNSSFDMSFLKMEFAKTGVKTNIHTYTPMCSLRLARASFPQLQRFKLSWLAYELELEPPDHSALGDAKTTLHLIQKIAESRGYAALNLGGSDRFLTESSTFPTSHLQKRPVIEVAPRSDFLKEVRVRLPFRTGLSAGVIEYLELLDEYLEDLHLSPSEIDHLISLASDWSLGQEELETAHQEYFELLAKEAKSDERITPSERLKLLVVGEILGMDEIEIQQAIFMDEHIDDLPLGLRKGDSVVLTGDMVPPKEIVASALQSRGLSIKSSVSSKTRLLVAADVNSVSGKAQAARRFGIPIMSTSDVYPTFIEAVDS